MGTKLNIEKRLLGSQKTLTPTCVLRKEPFDRVLVAQAAVEGMTLVTADVQVAKCPGSIRRV